MPFPRGRRERKIKEFSPELSKNYFFILSLDPYYFCSHEEREGASEGVLCRLSSFNEKCFA